MAALDYLNDPANQGLIGLATGLLQAGGPQRFPTSFGQALGQGALQGNQMAMQAQQLQSMQKLRELQGLAAVAKATPKPQLVDVPVPGKPGITQKQWVLPGAGSGTPIGGQVSPSPQLVDLPVPGKPGVTQKQWVIPGAGGGIPLGGTNDVGAVGPVAFGQKKELAQAGKPETTVNVDTSGSPFFKNLGKGAAEAFNAERADVVKSAQSIQMNQEARKLLDSGVITGSGANFVTNAGKVLERLGVPIGQDAEHTLANTQAFAAAMGRQVGSVIRLFGSGTGLSDADREYAQKIAGGEITLDEAAIRRLLDINDKLDQAKINAFNEKAKKIEQSPGYGLPYSVQVHAPELPSAPVAAPAQPAVRRYNPKTGKIE